MNFIIKAMKVFCILGVFFGFSADSAGMHYKTEDSDMWVNETPAFEQTKITHFSISNSRHQYSSEELAIATQVLQSNKDTLRRIFVSVPQASGNFSSFFKGLARDGVVGITHLSIRDSKDSDSSETFKTAAQWIQSNPGVFQGIFVDVSRTYKALIPFFRSLTDAREITYFSIRIGNLYNGSGTGSSEEIWGPFMEALAAFRSIKDLNMAWVVREELSKEMIDGLRWALDGKRLERLRIIGFLNMDDVLFELKPVLRAMPFKELNFTQVGITDDGADSIADILSGEARKTINTITPR